MTSLYCNINHSITHNPSINNTFRNTLQNPNVFNAGAAFLFSPHSAAPWPLGELTLSHVTKQFLMWSPLAWPSLTSASSLVPLCLGSWRRNPPSWGWWGKQHYGQPGSLLLSPAFSFAPFLLDMLELKF